MNCGKVIIKKGLFVVMILLALILGGIGGLSAKQAEATVLPENVTTLAEKSLNGAEANVAVCSINDEPVETWDISATSTDNVVAYLYNDPENLGYYTLSIEGTGAMANWYNSDKVVWKLYRENIRNAYISNGVTNIADYAFYNCVNLLSFDIPESVTVIGNYAFAYCESLVSIEIPKSVYQVSSGMFSYCTALEYVKYDSVRDFINDTISFTNAGENGNGIRLVIGANVTCIPSRMFSDSAIKSIEFEEGSICENIGEAAFSNCGRLTRIDIPESLKSIRNGAFYNCLSVTEINFNATLMNDFDSSNNVFNNIGKNADMVKMTVGANVKKIPDLLFYSSNTKVTHVEFAENSVCESIGKSAFDDCKDLEAVYITDVIAWASISFENWRSNPLCQGAKLYLNGELISGDIVIEEGVTSIGMYAFYNCTNIKSVTIPESVTSIGSSAFANCTAIEKIYYNAKSVLEDQNLVFDNAGENSNGIRLVIGANVACIPSGTFRYSKIASVEFEKGCKIERIGKDAFSSFNGLEGVYITDVTAWASISFENETANPLSYAKKLYLNGEIISGDIVIEEGVTSIEYRAFYNCSEITSITLPESLTSISREAFSCCSMLERINIPQKVEYIGYLAFNGCSIKRVDITDVTKWAGITYYDTNSSDSPLHGSAKLYLNGEFISGDIVLSKGITNIAHNAFYGCSEITSITLPEGIVSIGDCAFYNCTSLTSITLPDSLTSIGGSAFQYCSNLTNITLPEGLVSIGVCAFGYCTSLTSINLPDSLKTIGERVFYGCSSLMFNQYDNACYLGNEKNPYRVLIKAKNQEIESCIIHENTKIIYYSAFYSCSALTDIIIPNGVVSIDNMAFSGCTNLTNITILDGVESIGSSAFSGCTSLTNITIPGSVKIIGDYAFSNCTNLTNVTILDGVDSIGTSAFRDCTNITNITIPGSVKSFGGYAFEGCTNLMNVTILDGVDSIGSFAFRDCTNITNITIPGSVKSIGQDAFNGCKNITNVTIPSSVESIDWNAFYGCENLDLVYVESSAVASGYNNQGSFTKYAQTIAIRSDILDVNSSITSFFTNVQLLDCLVEDGKILRYNVYSKHSHDKDASIWATTENIDVLICTECGILKYSEHEHKWTNWSVINAPTQTEAGYAQRTCALGSSHVETCKIPALNSGAYVYTAPTCTENGSLRFENAEKGFVYEVVKNATGHSYDTVITNPTCTGPGYTTYTCHCGHSYQSDYTDIIEHVYGDWEIIVVPTCEEVGKECRNCINCPYSEFRDVPATGHDEETLVGRPSTCYQTGLTDGKWCRECEKILIAQQELPIVHNFYEVEKYIASCTEDGYNLMRCECGAEEKWNIVYALEHNMSNWIKSKEASCGEYGEEQRRCLNNNCSYVEKRQTDMLSHSYSASKEGKFECVNGCGDSYIVTKDGAMVSANRKVIFDCPTDFEFSVFYAGPKADLSQNIIIKQSVNSGNGIRVGFNVERGENANEWIISPEKEYKQGVTYSALLSGGAKLCGMYENTPLDGTILEFTIKITDNNLNIKFSDVVKLIPLSNISNGIDPTYNNEGFAYVSLKSITGLSVGDIVCLSAVNSLSDLINVNDYETASRSFIGKIVGIFANSNGTYQVKLQIPDNMGEVFSKYDVGVNLGFNTSAIPQVELDAIKDRVGNSIVEDLKSNKKFAEYLAAIGDSVDNYVTEYLADKGVSIKDMGGNGSDILNFKFDITPIDNGFIVTVVVVTKFPMKKGEMDYGTINVSLSLENTITVKAQNVGTKEDGFLYFDIRLVQENICKTNFNVSYDYHYVMEEKPFAKKNATGMIHRSNCRYVSYMKDPQLLDSCPKTGATYCSICKPQDYEDKTSDQILDEKLREELAYSDWGELLNKVQSGKNNSNSTLNKIIKGILEKVEISSSTPEKKGILLGRYNAVFGCFTAQFEVWFVFEFNINASLNYDYESKVTKIYGIKNDSSGASVYKMDGSDGYVTTDLRLMGGVSASAGFKAYVDIGFLNFIALGVQAELGAYRQVAGVIGTTTNSQSGSLEELFANQNGYSALYYEAGIYYSASIFGRISIFRINLLGGKRHDVPLYKLGYEKVYYSFTEPSGTMTLDVSNSNPTRANYIYLGNYKLDVKYLNLNAESNKGLDMSTQTGELVLDSNEEHYDIELSIEENDYCSLEGNELFIKDSGVSSFEIKLTLNVVGTDDWKVYKKDYENSVYYLEENYVITLNVTVHDWEQIGYIQPNCHTIECTTYKCNDCLEVYEEYGDLDPNNHTAIEIVQGKQPSCYEEGWVEYERCNDCQHTATINKISPTNAHVFNAYTVTKYPTCNEEGWEIQYCETKGCPAKGEERSIPKLGHEMAEVIVKKATCTTSGKKIDKCTRNNCGYTENERSYDDPTGHSLKTVAGKEPTCTANGYADYEKCNSCDYSTYEVIPKLGHDFVYYEGKEPTCTANGYEDYKECTRCNYSTYKVIPALGHDLKERAGKEPTCVADGWEPYQECLNIGCDYSTYKVIPKLGHDMKVLYHEEPTCTDGGWTDKKCSRCDIIEWGEIGPALGHDLKERAGKEPTCVDDGWKPYQECVREYCSHKVDYEIIPKTGEHTWSEVLINAPTYNSIGWRGNKCTVCDEVKDKKEIPKLPYSDGLIYQYIPSYNGYGVIGFNQTYLQDTVLMITPEYNGMPVVTIGESAFKSCKTIKKIILPDSVVSIQNGAFSWCQNLETVQFGNNMNSIGSNAFFWCNKLNDIRLPSGIKSISSTAFDSTGYYLNGNNWEDGVLYIGEYLICANNSNYGKVPENYTVKYGTTCIASTAFENVRTIQSITIPDTLSYVGDGAFLNCISLRMVHVTDVDAWCRIVFDSKQSNPLHIAHNLYENGEMVKRVVIPNDIKEINQNIFYGCHSLEEIIIPQSVTSIGDKAFYDCQSVKEITIPFVGAYAGNNGNNRTNKLPYLFDSVYGENVPHSLRKVTVTGDYPIADDAFSLCTTVTEIEILADVERIGFGAFADCESLTKLTLPYVGESKDGLTNNYFGYVFGIEGAFNHEELSANLKEVVLINESQIESYAFNDCKDIQYIYINDTCESIGDFAFKGCSSLKNITIGKNVKSIGNGAFSNLDSLETIVYNATNLIECPVIKSGNVGLSLSLTDNEGWSYVSTYEAFYQSGLECVTIIVGENVENIPDDVFYGLNKKNVYIQSASVLKELLTEESQGRLIENAEVVAVTVEKNNVPQCIVLHYAHMGKQELDGVSYTVYNKHEHDFINVEAKLPTCTENGWDEHIACANCDYSTRIEIPSKGGHTYGEWERIVEPTLDTMGIDQRICGDCGHHETRDVDVLGYLQAFVNAVEKLSDNESAERTYSEIYYALQLYSNLTEDEKQEVSDSFLALQSAINAYNLKAELANTEFEKATEIAFIPIHTRFTFLAMFLFLLKKKLWLK